MVAARVTRKQLRRKMKHEALERCEDVSESETCYSAHDDTYVDCLDCCEVDTVACGEEGCAAGAGFSPCITRARRALAKQSERLRAQQRANKWRQNICASEEYVLEMVSPRPRSLSPVVVPQIVEMPWMICGHNNDVREVREVHEGLEPRRRGRRSHAYAAVYNDGERFRAVSRGGRAA